MDVRSMVQYVNREEEERQAQTLAAKLQLPYLNLTNYPFAPQVLTLIPLDAIQSRSVVPYARAGTDLKIATAQPQDAATQQFLKEFGTTNGYQIELAVCSFSSVSYAVRLAQMAEAEPRESALAEEFRRPADNAAFLAKFANKEALAAELGKTSVSEALDVLFAGAIALRATDIHIEPGETQCTVRFRIDGVLQTIAELPMAMYSTLRSRIKYLSKLKLDIAETPQDGRFEYRSAKQKLDVRVSALPTGFGETFVLRLLTGGSADIQLGQLGFTPEQVATIRQAITQPNGLILNTGPTGSGKTTTLYAILQELNQPGRKIITIEDPVEYQIKGVQQTQINPSKQYDFPSALRSALRQDPDIMMVGEIRDAETATIAVQAALTGHLVISTLHTNSAAGAIPRLLDMGVKTYLLSGVIRLIIAQRLVRKLAHPEKAGDERFEGRIAITELLVPNEELETLIQQKASIDQFERAAHAAGMTPLFTDGMNKVKAGLTTEEEIKRVAADVANDR